MSNREDEIERKKFIKENPDSMEIFDEILNKVFGKKENDDDIKNTKE